MNYIITGTLKVKITITLPIKVWQCTWNMYNANSPKLNFPIAPIPLLSHKTFATHSNACTLKCYNTTSSLCNWTCYSCNMLLPVFMACAIHQECNRFCRMEIVLMWQLMISLPLMWYNHLQHAQKQLDYCICIYLAIHIAT